MKYTFIISSIGRMPQLQDCISSIEKSYEHFGKNKVSIETLIIFEGNNKKIKLQSQYPHLFLFYHFDKINLSAARNYGISNSDGDYLIFIDDDAKVKENFIEVLSKRIIEYDETNAFCGKLMDPVKNIPFSHLFCNNNVKKLNRLDYQYFMGSAHVLSRKVIRKIGGYDERFGSGAKYYGSEETDMFFRLKMAGEQVIYLPDLVFFHPIPLDPSHYIYKYAYAVGAVLTKHCFDDKFHFVIYCLAFFQIIAKALIRLLQKMVFKGIYEEKDKKYHYGSVVKGTLEGMESFVKDELLIKGREKT